ncbi:MAG TPA: hypothetical protein VF669_01055 [Tepidisphaeraceae bacterium]|jgi:hypothetical protein
MVRLCSFGTLVFVAAATLSVAAAGGCAQDKHADEATALATNEPLTAERVSPAAARKAYGEGEITFRAKERGRVWLFDDDRKSVLFFGDMNKGDRVTVTPRLHRATINGARLKVNDIFERNHHAIYFLSGDK